MKKLSLITARARVFSYSLFFVGCAALGFSSSALAVCTPTATTACIADQPIQSATIVKPNVMFVLDNSGSMTWTYMPDTSDDFRGKFGYHSSQCNDIYYDPATTYAPPKDSSNNDLPNAIFTSAKDSGFDATSTPRNLDSGFIANRFEPESANTDLKSFGSYLLSSLGPYSAFYYAYTGSVTTKKYNDTSSTFYTECNTSIGPDNAVFKKRRLSTTETTTIKVSGSSSTSVSSIKVNGVQLMSAATTANSTSSTVASRIAAKITLNGFSATYSGSTVTITGPTSAANYTPDIVKSGSMTLTADVFPDTTAAKLTNFANWYSYYRTRMLMMKSGMSTAFSAKDDKIRVGFHTINYPDYNSSTGRSLNIDDFAATQKNDWYAALWSVKGNDRTPLQNALARVGNYYANSGTKTGLSGDPVQYSCQKNFTILSTDGYWNNNGASVGNMDKTVPASMPIAQRKTTYDPADTDLTSGQKFPYPYYEGSAASNSLADVAMNYWVKDLRSSMANNVPTTTSDPAYWQHMNTYTVGLGVDGTLSYPGDWEALKAGTKTWPVPVADNPKAIDDLWHAAVNGRGQYYRATDPTSLSNSLNSALKAITDVPNYGAGPSTSTKDFRSPDQSDYTTYISSYRIINWSGDVKKYAVNRMTGLKTGDALWSAAKQLDSKVNPGLTSTVNSTAFKTRNIVTRTEAGVPVAFDYTALSATQQTALCYKVSGACVAGNSSLVDYLRGDATYEGAYGMGNSRFRDRNDSTESTYFKRDLIGTIINSGPAYVAIEQNNYQEVSDPGFADFKTTTKARAPALYVPANDGMVHALDAATGNELWAYVPSFVIPTGTDTEGKEKGLRALSYQDSGAPAYSHHFYVDATPKVGAVDFARTGGPIPLCTVKPCTPTPEWKNILVGGLGKGGKGYYALDVTIPATSLSDAKSKVLWEFPRATDTANQARMGYSFGQPLIAKTYAYGWVVMLPSGYNNSDGYGYVFVLNAKTGVLLETLKTTEKTPGMAHITFLAQTNNLYAEQVYGGDLNGNVWRFDFLSHTPAWSLTERVSQIFSSSVSTPITSEVNVSIDVNTNDRWVMFGTGQYLDVPDRETTGTQYLVSLRDGTADAPRTTGGAVALSTLATLSNPTSGSWSCATSGWKYALPTSGERITMNPAADLQTVIFASLIPSSDPCSSGTTGYVYGLDYCSGHNRLKTAGLSLPLGPGGGIPCANGCLPPESPVLGKDGKAKVKIMDGSNGISATIDTSRIYSGTRHVGWRELLNEY